MAFCCRVQKEVVLITNNTDTHKQIPSLLGHQAIAHRHITSNVDSLPTEGETFGKSEAKFCGAK